MNQQSVTVVLSKGKVTKNTIRYEEAPAPFGESQQIGTLYVPNATLARLNGGAAPEAIRVTVEAA